jgi:DNA-binding NarL/FixJ family response regulator
MSTAKQEWIEVLIADGSPVVRERLCELLKEEPRLRVVGQAGTAAEAWAMFAQRRPAAVVLDLQLPDGSGLEVLRRVKQADPACVVVMWTNYHDPVYQQECRRHGADHFLCKATEFEQAADLLGRLVAHPQPLSRTETNGPAQSHGAGESIPCPFPAQALSQPATVRAHPPQQPTAL